MEPAVQPGCRTSRSHRTVPLVETARMVRVDAEAERQLWTLAETGRADGTHDERYCALIFLATFASLRWGEAVVLQQQGV